MRPFILICFFLTLLSAGTNFSYAAFPIHKTNTNVTVPSAQQASVDFKQKVNTAVKRITGKPASISRKQAESGDAISSGGGGTGIASLVLGVLGIVALVAAFASGVGILLLFAGLAGIAAIITGAIGIRQRENRGMAIAGLVLGITDLAIVLAIVALAIAIISAFK